MWWFSEITSPTATRGCFISHTPCNHVRWVFSFLSSVTTRPLFPCSCRNFALWGSCDLDTPSPLLSPSPHHSSSFTEDFSFWFPVFLSTPNSVITLCNLSILRKGHFSPLASQFLHLLISSDLLFLSTSVTHSNSCPLGHCTISKILKANIKVLELSITF